MARAAERAMAGHQQMGPYASESPQSGLTNGTLVGAGERRYEIQIEGRLYPWAEEAITPQDIRRLGGMPGGTPVVAVDLASGEVWPLRESESHRLVPRLPGKGHDKQIRFEARRR